MKQIVPLDFGGSPEAIAEEDAAAREKRLARQLSVLAAVALDLQDNATVWAEQRWGSAARSVGTNTDMQRTGVHRRVLSYSFLQHHRCPV